MDLTAIWVRRSKTFAVTFLFLTGFVFGQDAPIVSPPLTMKPGTTLTIRVNELLSPDHNRIGDVFSATLTQPVIVLGIVVARYGQIAVGQVVEAKKAGRASGVSHLGLTLTNLTLVDGQTVPIQSQLLVREGPTTVVRPETPLTFHVAAPVTIETNNAPQAFRFVNFADDPPTQAQPQQVPAYPAPPPYPYPYHVYYAPPYYPYYYPIYGYPYFYGPSFSFFFGYPGYYHGYYGGHYGYLYAPRPVPIRGGMIASTFHGGAHH